VATKPALTAESSRPADIRSRHAYAAPLSRLRTAARRLLSIASLVVIDVTGLAFGLYGALALREVYYGRDPLWGVLWEAEKSWLPFLTLVTLLVFWHGGLYASRERRAGFGRLVGSLVLVAALALAFGVGVGHEFRTYGIVPAALLLTIAFIGLLRASYEAVTGDVLRAAGVRRRAVLVGNGEHLGDLHRALGTGRGGIDYELVGALAPSSDGVPLSVLGDLSALPDILDARTIDELIVVESDLDEQQLLELVDEAHRRGVQVRVAPRTTELLTQRAEYVPGQGIPLFELRPPVFAGVDWVLKRGFDLVVSGLIVLVGSPIWVAIALGVKLTSAGPVFYRDRRVGLGEHEFDMFKFRTMYADAAERQRELEAANEAAGPLFKIRDDPRVTPLGRFLRRFSLDEIPQLLNVLRGDMSLVGPRPLPVRDYVQLEPWHRKRYLVLPGMTGLWQISGRIDLSFDDLVRLDFYYLDNWSIWLDVSILGRTIPAVLFSRGAY
jgi:exopolysaccharide biosynthesis polyprenyl glycosylphosphotransferase